MRFFRGDAHTNVVSTDQRSQKQGIALTSGIAPSNLTKEHASFLSLEWSTSVISDRTSAFHCWWYTPTVCTGYCFHMKNYGLDTYGACLEVVQHTGRHTSWRMQAHKHGDTGHEKVSRLSVHPVQLTWWTKCFRHTSIKAHSRRYTVCSYHVNNSGRSRAPISPILGISSYSRYVREAAVWGILLILTNKIMAWCKKLYAVSCVRLYSHHRLASPAVQFWLSPANRQLMLVGVVVKYASSTKLNPWKKHFLEYVPVLWTNVVQMTPSSWIADSINPREHQPPTRTVLLATSI